MTLIETLSPIPTTAGAAAPLAAALEGWLRVVLLQDHNTRVVVTGTAILGAASGVVGCFLLLRRRALIGDVISHASLPGIAGAFIAAVALERGGIAKSLPVLLAGATATGALGVGVVLLIRNLTRLKEDAALAITLGVFFGAGVAGLGFVQQMETAQAAGLESFIYGQTAAMLERDALLIAGSALVAIVAALLLVKELTLICFDPGFAEAQGWPVRLLDSSLMALAVLVTVVGLQAVGLILMVAFLIIPAAGARFWSERLGAVLGIAAVLGAASGAGGTMVSALAPRLPAGAVIVLAATALFLVSLFAGPVRGLIPEGVRRLRLSRLVARQHVLRAMYEAAEARLPAPESGEPGPALEPAVLRRRRAFSPGRLRRELKRLARAGLAERAGGAWRLTPAGLDAARRVVRNHRLWELYLIHYADVAPSHVDRGADDVEHVLGEQLVRELERSTEATAPVPPSPHRVETTGEAA